MKKSQGSSFREEVSGSSLREEILEQKISDKNYSAI
jgi:hypothetical protein